MMMKHLLTKRHTLRSFKALTQDFLKDYAQFEKMLKSSRTKPEKLQAQHEKIYLSLKNLNINRKLMNTVIEHLAEYSTVIHEAHQDIRYYAKRMKTMMLS